MEGLAAAPKTTGMSEPEFASQAAFWRWLTLLQIVTVFGAMYFAGSTYINYRTMLAVPEPLLPGRYSAREINTAEFISFAEGWINLVSTYQHYNAESQFNEAESMIVEPYRSRFHADYMTVELRAIQQTRRSQMVVFDPWLTDIVRKTDDIVEGTFVGYGTKLIDGQEFEVSLVWVVTMQIYEGKTKNDYGVVITDAERFEEKYGTE